MAKRYAEVNGKQCVACGVCVKACPKDAAEIHKGCYAVIDVKKCVGCGKCTGECPAGCIVLKEREAE